MKTLTRLVAAFSLCSSALLANNLYFAYSELASTDVPAFLPNTTQSSLTDTINGATNKAFADLATGKIGVLNAGVGGSVPFGVYEPIAQLGDTITAQGPASGLSGLNLNINLTENGTTSFTNPADNFSFLWVFLFHPGTFDQTIFTTPSNIIAADGYLIGQGTQTAIASALFANNNVPLTATYGDGTNSIPLTLPFSTIGSNFQIEIVLGSAEAAFDPGDSWSADFSHTIDISLSADPGVTLTSASGLFPGASSVPEPATWSLLLTALSLAALRRKLKT